MAMRCEDCQELTGKPYARYCDAHRWRHRRTPATYRLTPERRAYLMTHYRPLERGVSYRVAAALQVPKWRVCRWAAELGLSRQAQSERRLWTPVEEAFIEQHLGSRTVGWIAKQLSRSVTAVHVRSKRLSLSRRDSREWYTASQVATGFGIDSHLVGRWIERGWLPAQRFGQDYPDGRPAAWRISVPAVRRFAQEHQTAYSLMRVDQLWFLDLIFDGAIGIKRDAVA